MSSLVMFGRIKEGQGFNHQLDGRFSAWRRQSRAIGGYHIGKMAIKDVAPIILTEYYNNWLGRVIEERHFGAIAYRGIVWELELVRNGIHYRRTMNPTEWHNSVKTFFTDDGLVGSIGWDSNAGSVSQYGTMEYVYSLGESNATAAQSKNDSELARKAWPKSRMVGGTDVGHETGPAGTDGLFVTTIGLGATLNWQYYELNSGGSASAVIPALLAHAEFVTAGRIELNTNTVSANGQDSPQRLRDLIYKIVDEGDGSGNIWKGGVYEGDDFDFEPEPTTVDYALVNGRLYHTPTFTLAELPLVKPGFYLLDVNAPGYLNASSPTYNTGTFDNPQVTYFDSIEFIWPDTLKLGFKNSKPTVIARQYSGIASHPSPAPPPGPPVIPPGGGGAPFPDPSQPTPPTGNPPGIQPL